MNYSTLALLLLMAYLWHSNSLMKEINYIKEILNALYKIVESKLYTLLDEVEAMRNETLLYLVQLHNITLYTMSVVKNNSLKIDSLHDKLDRLLIK
ncbi:GP16 [Adoxophyes orana nucleopolyhedrovirus]|uniref:GP16 n=1 Tax=Adoxophyes orana nucleopolyhedrovirus TaxID=542343 RepID=UPI0001829C31|nr:GP16 [Adoxophyes orana nucleopolyhedrovirus]ACF05390.1 GP16 [Adoxophyes orana nucleopolyhedrovirus]